MSPTSTGATRPETNGKQVLKHLKKCMIKTQKSVPKSPKNGVEHTMGILGKNMETCGEQDSRPEFSNRRVYTERHHQMKSNSAT